MPHQTSFDQSFQLSYFFIASLCLLGSVWAVRIKMNLADNPVLRLRAQIASLQGALADLKTQLIDAEAYYNRSTFAQADSSGHLVQPPNYNEKTFESLVDQMEMSQEEKWGRSRELTMEEHKRYGRQLIMPEIGLRGGPSSLKHDVPLSLTPIGNRAAAT